MANEMEIEKDGVKLTLKYSPTKTAILVSINDEYVGDIRPELDKDGKAYARLFSSNMRLKQTSLSYTDLFPSED